LRCRDRLGETYLAQTEHLHNDWQLVQEYPLSPSLLAMSRVWQAKEQTEPVIAAKGAPEAIAAILRGNVSGASSFSMLLASWSCSRYG